MVLLNALSHYVHTYQLDKGFNDSVVDHWVLHHCTGSLWIIGYSRVLITSITMMRIILSAVVILGNMRLSDPPMPRSAKLTITATIPINSIASYTKKKAYIEC